MYFENTGLEDKSVDIVILDELMRNHGLIRSSAWDYERVTWDRKFIAPEGTFYLRVFGTSEGDIGANDAVILLLKPVLGKYYFPHGVEYGDDELYSVNVIAQCKKILESINEKVQTFAIS